MIIGPLITDNQLYLLSIWVELHAGIRSVCNSYEKEPEQFFGPINITVATFINCIVTMCYRYIRMLVDTWL